MSDNEDRFNGFEIAVVGMSCRFPGADNVDAFWRNLSNGVESIQRFSQQELIDLGHDPEVVRQSNFIPAHGAVNHYNTFDARFFGYTPREAGVMDPQQRLFLELAWEALENAGYAPKSMQVPVGIFAGTSTNTYLEANVRKNQQVLAAISDFQANVLNQSDFLATRASYKLGLSGSSFTIQSACSTSLVATHVACQQLISGSCDLALAGGVSITLPRNWGYQYQEGMIYSPDGHCRAFDEKASGTLKGDGGGIVVLKRLADAIEDGDHIEAIILGSASNNDAQAKVGFTAPGLDGQVDVIQTALLMADVEAKSISNIECHGTGTPMGDPIEIAALTKAFGPDVDKNVCAVGSVKTNIGHLDAGAGVAGLIKTVLALKHKTLPPSLNFSHPNPVINFEQTPFYVNHSCKPWQAGPFPRRGGVSSFGIGGTNAHIILEETPEDLLIPLEADPEASYLLGWSAQSKAALDDYKQLLLEALLSTDCPSIRNIAFTLNIGRERFSHRRAMICQNTQQAIDILSSPSSPSLVTAQSFGESSSIGFMFPGQGSQYVNMGRGLYQNEPVFAQQVDLCASMLLAHMEVDIRHILYPELGGQVDHATDTLTQTAFTQPALFVMGYALAKLWQSKGIQPAVVLGHSIGEYAAACVAGVFSLEDALLLVAKRGAMMQSLPAGDMLSVRLSAAQTRPYLSEALSIAAINSPELCVVSGPANDITAVAESLERQGVTCKLLQTSHGFHSAMMEPMLSEFENLLSTCQLNSPNIEMISTVTGKLVAPEVVTTKQYWLDNIRQPVDFAAAAQTLLAQSGQVFIECGPGNTLSSLLRACADKPAEVSCINSFRHSLEEVGDDVFFNAAHAKLWTYGVELAEPLMPTSGRRVPLPTYPFQRKLCWVEPQQHSPAANFNTQKVNVEQKMPLHQWFYAPTWQSQKLNFKTPITDPQQRWLVLSEDAEFLQQIKIELAAQKIDVISIAEYSSSASLANLAKTLGDFVPNHIVVINTREIRSCAEQPPDSAPFYNLLALLQSLLSVLDFSQLQFNYVSRNACSVNPQTECMPQRLMPLGLLRSLQAEYVGLKARFINVNEPAMIQATGLIAECLAEDGPLLINYQFGQRWTQQLQNVELPPSNTAISRLRVGGTYLITGGLGAMGLAFAKHLAQQYQANLILLSREALPQQNEWDAWLAQHPESDGVSSKIRAVKELQEVAANVMSVAVDVADSVGLENVKKQVLERFGEINGLIHAAGVPGGGIIATMQQQTIQQVFSSKVIGTWNLNHTFADIKMDFMLLCSSLTSFIDRPGRGEYSAANYYLDGFANSANQFTQTPVLSINWDAWSGSSMSQTAGAESAQERIESDEGVEALLRSLQSGWPQVIVSTRNLCPPNSIEQPQESIQGSASSIEVKEHLLQSDQQVFDPSLTPAQQILSAIWQDLLGVDDLSISDNFFELGGDSIVSLQMTSRAAQKGLKITARQVFENQTIEALAKLVEDQVQAHGSLQTADSDDHTCEHQPQQLITGETPLTPIQSWFFANEFAHPEHWNLYHQLSLPTLISAEQLRLVLQSIVLQHDVLRSQFIKVSDGWTQRVQGDEHKLEFERIALKSQNQQDLDTELAALIEQQSASLNLNGGNLYRFVMLDNPLNNDVTLLIVIHHLLVDIVSFNIILDDMRSAWLAVKAGRPVKLPAKTISFQDFAAGLQQYSTSQQCQQDYQYWREYENLTLLGLPVDSQHGDNAVSSASQQTLILDSATTARMTKGLSKLGIQAKDVLLSTLVLTLAEFTGQSRILIELEEHGRDVLQDDYDVSRTVGWFTKAYPVHFTVPAFNHPMACVSSVQKMAEQASEVGLSYGLHKQQFNAQQTTSNASAPQVVFLYQGNVLHDETKGEFTPLKPCQASRYAQQIRTHLLEFNIWIEQGQAHINVGFSHQRHEAQTIKGVLACFERICLHLVDTLMLEQGLSSKEVTSSDVLVSKTVASNNSCLQFPLSFAQERVWFLEQIESQSTLHNKHSVLKINGPVKTEYLHQAISELTKQHQSLRTTFNKVDGEPRQCVHPNVEIVMPKVIISSDEKGSVEDKLKLLSETELNQPFDLERGPLIRLRLVEISPDKHFLLITLHHIIIDAWSMQLFFNQLERLYHVFSLDESTHAIEKPKQYSEFVNWQRDGIDSKPIVESLAFWRQKLHGLPTRIELPTDRVRPALQTFVGDKVDISLSLDMAAKLRRFCASQGVSVYMAMLTVFNILLAKYSGQTDIVVGTPVANRPQRAFESIIGLLVNNLVLRSDLSANPKFSQLLHQVRSDVLDANEHANVPFEKVVQALNPERDRSQSPLFQVMMVFMNAPQGKAGVQTSHGVNMQPEEIHNRISEFDLSLYVYEEGASQDAKHQSLTAWFEFNTALFNHERISLMADHYIHLLDQVLDDANVAIDNLQLMSPLQIEQQVRDWKGKSVELTDVHKLELQLEQLLCASFITQGTAEALRCGDDILTYQQLDLDSKSLARQLQTMGVGPEVPVAIFIQRSTDMLVAMLAVLRAGGCYVPLDPSFPADRIDYMLKDSESKLVLTTGSLQSSLPDNNCQLLIKERWPKFVQHQDDIVCHAKPENLAYVIYTSGSTGLPKGVRIERRNVINFLLSMAQQPGLDSKDTFVAVTTISFDIHVLELWLPLMVGARLVIANSQQASDGHALLALLKNSHATAMQATPATWHLLLQCGWQHPLHIKALCGGEPLTEALCNKLMSLTDSVWNMYGPTETCVWSSVEKIVDSDELITVGRPIANTQFYIVDKSMNLLPAGISGELLIGGAGVVRDYFKREDLNAQQFVFNPIKSIETGKVYRTGDSAQWLTDGRVIIKGRIDNQVKLRGYRIELGEIETRLRQHEDVKDAVVALRGEAENIRLVAWLKGNDNSLPSNASLRAFLQLKLPDYMLPAVFAWVDEFAMTPNNKVDRKALIEPVFEQINSSQEHKMLTDAEQLVANVFARVLNVPQVDRLDNFFDLGGHSLLSMKVVDQIEQQSGVRIHPGELFQQSVGQIAAMYQDSLINDKGQ
ncbi:non-ribosomal peptide synthetase/type I polyketide synthase [Aliiglaciecola sp. LCG003]|uniref:non-ribosomal peptide synthetase/type I polyketide synthase n=1 Tax=Aliiglaciecola sp. LCG003 TaxID=3053655 RepID=UPI002572EEC6|nr:non-ribosomal peptide synthetase/type I polyketide synthase [Aliiglaciecola sp. LCG003]WJG09754.1 amino acid adenylation domain-containing protein [Aliiglaciecola sp. LCG003]